MLLVCAGLATGGGSTVCVRASTPAPDMEHEVKAAFLLNFARFVEWPSSAAGASDVCTLGEDPFGPILEKTIQGKVAAGRALGVRRLAPGAPVGGCAIVFVGEADPTQRARAIRELGDQPVLSVAETAGFAQEGGIIGFVLEENRVRFEVNLPAAERAGLRVSSRLLDLARVVGSNGSR